MDSCLEGDHDHFAALQEFELTNVDVNRAQIPQHVQAQPTLIIVSLSVRLSVLVRPEAQRSGGLGERRAAAFASQHHHRPHHH